MPEKITIEDFMRLTAEFSANLDRYDEDTAVMQWVKNEEVLDPDVLAELADYLQTSFAFSCIVTKAQEGEDFDIGEMLKAFSLTCFSLGWNAHKQYGKLQSQVTVEEEI